MTRFWLLVLALGVAAPTTFAQDSETQTLTSLERILKNPNAFRNVKATFVLQFHQLGNVDNPVFTKFDRNWYQSFSAWSDGVPVWDRQVYRESYPYLFLPRISEGTKTVVSSPPFTRFLVTGIVEEVFDGKPYIEIVAMEKLDKALTTGTVRSIAKGYQLRSQGQHGEAAKHFRGADSDALPLAVRSLVVREEAWSLHQAGETLEGMNRLRASLQWLKNDPLIVDALRVARASLHLDENDRPIETSEVVDVQTDPVRQGGEVRVEQNPAPEPVPAPPVVPVPDGNQD